MKVFLILAVAACTSEIPLEDRQCPCAPGNACRVADNTCVPFEAEAPGNAPLRCARDVAECPVEEQYIVQSFESGADLSRQLVGRWLWCGETSLDPNAVGIEFAADGRFYLLRDQGDGTCVRSIGFERAGSWSTDDISEQNTPGTYQVVMRWDGGGSGGIIPAFSGQPRKLRDRGPGSLGTLVADPQ
jgi:hypothetical protein